MNAIQVMAEIEANIQQAQALVARSKEAATDRRTRRDLVEQARGLLARNDAIRKASGYDPEILQGSLQLLSADERAALMHVARQRAGVHSPGATAPKAPRLTRQMI